MDFVATARSLAKRAIGPAQIDETYIVHFALRGRRGVMIDIGAHYGHTLAPFAHDGWEVHAFEPDPDNRTRLQAAFGQRTNVTIVPKAVSNHAGQMPLFTSSESTGISSLTPFTAGHQQTAVVEIITLRDYIAVTGISSIDFMKIDVEGHERHVLGGHDWSVAPEVIVLEFEDAKTLPLGYVWTDLANELVGRGYEVLVSEWFPIERYGAAHRWRQFKSYPSQLEDPAAWGNLIAARSLERLAPAIRHAVRRYRLRQQIAPLLRRLPARVR